MVNRLIEEGRVSELGLVVLDEVHVLACISPVSLPYLPCISPVSRLHLPCISPRRGAHARRGREGLPPRAPPHQAARAEQALALLTGFPTERLSLQGSEQPSAYAAASDISSDGTDRDVLWSRLLSAHEAG